MLSSSFNSPVVLIFTPITTLLRYGSVVAAITEFTISRAHQACSPVTSAMGTKLIESLAYYDSAPSCNHFGRHGEWKKYLATKILVKVAYRLKEKLN